MGITGWIEARANEFLKTGLQNVQRMPYEKALRAANTHRHDFLNVYVNDFGNVLDMDAIRGVKIKMGVMHLVAPASTIGPRLPSTTT